MEGKQWELSEEKQKSMGVLMCLGNVKQIELLDLGRAILLIRDMIISIPDVLCFQGHSSEVFPCRQLEILGVRRERLWSQRLGERHERMFLWGVVWAIRPLTEKVS